MNDTEREPVAQDSNEPRPEDWVEPKTDGPELGLAPETSRFVESAEMIAIRTRVEQGEPLSEELWTAYSEAGSLITDAEGGSSMARLEFRLKFAELKIEAGLLDDAWEDLEELSMTPEMEEFPEFGAKVLDAIKRTG